MHRIILSFAPEIDHIFVVRTESVTRLAGGMHSKRIVEIAKIHEHPHGRQCGYVE